MPEFPKMEIVDCFSCGRTHASVILAPYNSNMSGREHPYFTHHYHCPHTNDPCPLRLESESDTMIDEETVYQLVKSIASGRALVSIWHLEGPREAGGEAVIKNWWKMYNYPWDDLLPSLEQFLDDVNKKMKGRTEPEEDAEPVSLSVPDFMKKMGVFTHLESD